MPRTLKDYFCGSKTQLQQVSDDQQHFLTSLPTHRNLDCIFAFNTICYIAYRTLVRVLN